MFSVVLSLGLLTVASSRQLLRAEDSPQRIESVPESLKLTVDIPPVDQRNPAKCEMYESSHMEEGCRQTCSVSGYFANHRIQESQRRKVSQCRATGSYCRVHLARNSEMNVTMSNGRCTSDCRCVPVTDESQVGMGIEMVASALVAKFEHQRSHHRVRNGLNRYGKLKIHVPSSESRNQTGCENYEQNYFFGRRHRVEYQCKDVCSVRGNIGSLWFQGKPRVLESRTQEGTYCELKVRGDGKFEVRGAEQVISGKCRKGVCRPRDWVEPAMSGQLIDGVSQSGNMIHISGEAMRNARHS